MPRARAAILRRTGAPHSIETIAIAEPGPGDVLVRIRAAGLCHTDLEAIEGQLAIPLPAVLGHEAAGEIAAIGPGVTGLAAGDHVVLSWNPHCGHCFYCDRDQPILCTQYLGNASASFHFDGKPRLACEQVPIHQLMYLGAFAEYCVLPAHCAIRVPEALPFDQAALIGCGVMTGIGAATRIADLRWGAIALVIGCGAVGLSAIQGCRLAGAGRILAVDPNPARRALALRLGADAAVAPDQALDATRDATEGRGADVVIEAAGVPAGFALSVEAARPGGQVIWLGKTAVGAAVGFRWGSLMQEKRITRASYGGARPARDFPLIAEAALAGRIDLAAMVSARIGLAELDAGFAALKRGETVRSVVMFGDTP
ncbi:MAG: alcohol dehydrogenase catalytic domain-containing protein [Rhodospirillales bacterium]|nr:alcohol dehydrogenase catalytic domain-containing protein [Rhodospirillales bacterium]